MKSGEIANQLILSEELSSNMAGLLSAMPGGFFIYHADGDEELVYANDACIRIFGCDTLDQFKALTGFTFPGLVHPDDIQKVEQSISRQIANDDHKMDYVEYRILTLDGSVRWIQDYGHYVTTETGSYFYVFIDDATDRLHERMERLEKMNQELNDAYNREHEHRSMLRRALEQANAANVAKNTFLNNMSHDSRTLLNAITGYAHLIAMRPDDAEQAQRYAERITEASNQLLDVVSETLEVSRFEAGKSQIVEEECSLSKIIKGLEKKFAKRAEMSDVNLSVEMRSVEHDAIYADGQRISQALTQLLDNAIKFTPAGGSVTLVIDELKDVISGHGKFRITLSDTGVGMSPEFLERIFDPFERESTTTETGVMGTGLGLTITKHIFDLLSGTITVESTEGVGTTIEATFTAKLIDESMPRPQSEASHRQAHNILVVEDNALNREIITCLLEDEGYTVACATNGQEAVELVSESRPGEFDIVLMDIQMPVMNGYEATKAIRALEDQTNASVPIIAVTSDAFPEDRKRSLSLGMNAHVSKPITIEELNQAIHEVL